MKFFVKNMVCPRCIKVVKEELEKIGVVILDISLGEVLLKEIPDEEQLAIIKATLEANGFELLEDRKKQIVDRIKTVIISFVRWEHEKTGKTKLSDLLTEELNFEYSYLSSLFRGIEGDTIEHYLILQKIEYVKELLKYDELTLSEIAFKLDYSSTAHLSNQFKKITGMTAGEYKNISTNPRKPLDNLS